MLPKELLKEIRRIEIKTRKLVNTVYSGGYKSVFKGRGIEFAGIRKYYRGDDFRSLDWKVSARTADLYVREHIEERELQVLLALDLSGSMSFGTGSREKRESAAELAAAIAMAADKNNDKAGICLFTDKVEKYIHPARGRTHILRLIRELLYYVPENKKTDLKAPIEHINSVLTGRSVIFLITDAINHEDFTRELRPTAAKHDLIVAIIRDRHEMNLPEIGLLEVEDPETGQETTIDTSDPEVVKKIVEQINSRDEAFIRVCKNMGVDVLTLEAGKPVTKPLCRFFNERERRL